MSNHKVHNQIIDKLLKNNYSIEDFNKLYNLLLNNNTFKFDSLNNGLFPAAVLTSDNKFTNYDKVWIRDNIHIANAFYENSDLDKAQKTIYSLGDFFYKYKIKFISVISDISNPDIAMNRPHIRFDGTNLLELKEKWAHAENDALGYYMWLMLKMANSADFNFRNQEIELLPLFVAYFNKIAYWKDEDSGHWEETRKIETSSIGVVVCALNELKKFLINKNISNKLKNTLNIDPLFIDRLIEKGRKELLNILPNECIQQNKYREVDAAQLFLIYPLEIFKNIIVNDEIKNTILNNVLSKLKGEIGIKRYLGDSFWTANAKRKQDKTEITADYSERIEERNKNHQLGEEAQWCIFDPIVSIIYGKNYLKYGRMEDYSLQIYYFNRSLAHITGDNCKYGSFKCPELYYLEDSEYINNDTIPLLWTQANLMLAFKEMKNSILLTEPNQANNR